MSPTEPLPTVPEDFAADATRRGKVLDVLALSLADGRLPGPTALGLALAAVLEHTAEAAAFNVAVDGEHPVGVVLAVRSPRVGLTGLGDSAAARSGLSVGVATGETRKESELGDLVAVAIEGLEVARSTESLTAVHTELYELVTQMRNRRGRTFEVHGQTEGSLAAATRPADAPDVIPSVAPSTDLPTAMPPGGTPTEGAPKKRGRGKRTEVDDPFAFIDTNDAVLTTDRATQLTDGIAPTTLALVRLEEEQTRERDALREEIEALRAESSSLKRGQKDQRSILERRIDKLIDELSGAENEIERLRLAQEEDEGVPSAFRSVQGIREGDAQREIKRGALERVFHKNKPKR